MSRDSVFYTAVTGFVFPLGLLNALVLTHYLSTTQYGQLGILFFVSGLMSVVLNLLFLRGTERQVWGASDEGVDVDAAELVEAHRRPRVLGTGLVMSVVIGVIAVAATIPLAPWLSQLLVHTPQLAAAVVWTSASGALGSTWRLTANIGRWERRRAGFGWVWVLRPSFALVIAWVLVARGYGVAGAMAATAIGTLLSMLYGLFASRHSYQLVLDRQAVGDIARTSARFAAMVIGLFILHNGDVFFLSRFASSSEVGIYKLATNLSSIVSYAVSAFLMAWAPLEFSTLFQAAYERHGKDRVRAEFLHYYLLFGIFAVLVLAALATPLVSLFSPSYASATGFVAITGAGYLAYGLFLVVARSSTFEYRYFIYGSAAIIAAASLAATSLLLGPPLGGYGVAIGDIVGGLAGVGVIVFVAYFWGELPHADGGRIAGLLLIGGACWALGGPVAHLDHTFEPLMALASVVLFVAAVFATGVIPADQRSTLWAIARSTLRSRTPAEPTLARTAGLPYTDRQILIALTRDHQTPAAVSARTGLPQDTVRLRLVATLRLLTGAGAPTEDDLDISEYLLDTDSITQRDAVARELWQRGVDAMQLHQVEVAFATLSNAPERAWPVSQASAGNAWATPGPWLDEADLRLLDELVRSGRPAPDVASELEIDPAEINRRLVGALRALEGQPSAQAKPSGPADSLIGAFLSGWPTRPAAGELWAAGVDPIEVHRLHLTLEWIRTAPPGRWRRIAQAATNGSSPAGAPEAHPFGEPASA